MVLIGQVNPQLVTAINLHGDYAVGVSGEDAGLIRAAARDPRLGFVGDVTAINPAILDGLLADEFIPVVATIGTDEHGQAYNINADAVAGAIAEALDAEKLVYLTDVEGLRRDVDDAASLIRQTTADELEALIGDGIDRRRHDPQGRGVRPRRAQRRRPGAHPRRTHRPRPVARDLHRRRHRHDDRWRTDVSTNTHAFTTEVYGDLDHCPFMPVFGPPQVMFVRGKGTELWDSEGRRYLDFLSGLAVTSLGHAHPAVAEALAHQAGELLHVSNFFANPVATRAAIEVDRLLSAATGAPGQVFFTNSGAEAVECALKLARKHGGRGRHVVVSAFGSFHGRTLAALAATGQPTKHEPFQPMPEGFRHVAWGDLDALAGAVDASVAAVLIEPVQGEGGVNPAPPGYLAGIRELCDQTGALMMVDEIQTGFARTGRWFGFEHDQVAPDVVTLAKAMGNGVPVGACWARRDVAAVFEPGDHGSTYSGTAIATAAVNAVIDEMRHIDAPALAARQGAKLAAALAALPEGLLGARARAAPRRRARRCRGTHGVPRAARSRAGGQRGHPDRVAAGPADHGVRRPHRRGRRPDRGGAGVTRHLLEVTNLTGPEVRTVLDLAARPPAELGRPLEGLGAALIFEKPSARTRQSMEMAVVQLGGHPVYTRAEEIGIDVREPVEDVVRIFQGYHALLAARCLRPRGARPDGGRGDRSGGEHALRPGPSAAGPGRRVDDGAAARPAGRDARWRGSATTTTSPARSARSARCSGPRSGYACPVGYDPGPAEVERLTLLGAAAVVAGHRPDEAVAGADAVHADTWVSMGQEADKVARKQAFEGFTVDDRLMGLAAPGAVFMHCLPAYRGLEVTADVIDGPQSAVIEQGHNRLPAARAALAFLLGVRP